MSEQLRAPALLPAGHTYTNTLLGTVLDDDTGPNGLPVSLKENTALLSSCGLIATPLRVPLPELGGKACSVWVHSVSTC